MIKTIDINAIHEVSSIVALCQENFLSQFYFNWNKDSLFDLLNISKGLGYYHSEGSLMGFILYLDLSGSKNLENHSHFFNLVEIACLATHPKFQGKGVMSTLMKELKTQFQEVWLEVHEQNKKAIDFYKLQEFQEVGFRKKYYADGCGAQLLTWKKQDLIGISKDQKPNPTQVL